MSSSNIGDSGMSAAGDKSNFNQTCSLLRQYFKENGSLADLNIGFNNLDLEGNTASNTKKTLDLLPMIEKSGNLAPQEETEAEKSQLTIFYAGKVMVFNDFPADKLEEIVSVAREGILPNGNNFREGSVTTPVVPCFDINMVQPNLSTKINDLPIARKNSLARFLEKRKDRITSRAPYKTANKRIVVSKPADENKPWLGLAEASNGGGDGGQFPMNIN